MRSVNYAVIGVSVLAAIIITIYASQQLQTKSTDLPVATNPTFKLGMYGKTLSHEEAESILGYKIKIPTYLPEGNELRMIKVDEQTKWSYIIYSPAEADDSTEERVLIEKRGFIMINAPAPEVTDADAEINRFIDFGGREIIMENTRGVGFTNIPLMPGYSEIHWWSDGLHHIVGANFDLPEITKIIESALKS